MSEDKRTKYGTGPAAVVPRPGTGPTPAQTPNYTPAPAPNYTPAPQQQYTPAPQQPYNPSPSQATAILQPTPPGTDPPYTPNPAGASMSTSYLQQGDPMIGATLAGRYVISKKLGEGGMGAVYLATHMLLDKQVALKVLHGEFARKPDLVERFMQEAKAASRIRHENVIDISDFGTTPEGMVFFAMEHLKGHDLHEEVARARLNGQLLPWQRSKRIFLQICAALTAAHSHGIVHRDLKPENIYLIDFLGDQDFVKLLDFGIAKQTETEDGGRKLTKTGMLFGTPEYMSPEQARGEQVDHRVDVYAMGCILFQLVTGRVPFEADNFMGVLTLHLTEPPPQIPPEVFDLIGAPRELAGVIDRALQKDKTMRWSTIEELANGVRRVCGDPIQTAGAIKVQQANVTAGQSAVIPAMSTAQRQRTQWTGNVKVPVSETEMVDGRPGKSKVPLIIGALVVVGGAAVAAFLAFGRGGGGDNPTTTPSGSDGSNIAGIGPGTAAPPPTPDAAVQVPPELPPLPERVKIKLGSKPTGAEVRDVVKDRVLGKTPVSLDVKGSREPISLQITMKGYSDLIIDLTPDKSFDYVVPLEKGVSGTPVRKVVGAGSATVKPDGPTVKPDGSGTPTITPPPEVKPDAAVKPPEDECPDPDMPCLKKFP